MEAPNNLERLTVSIVPHTQFLDEDCGERLVAADPTISCPRHRVLLRGLIVAILLGMRYLASAFLVVLVGCDDCGEATPSIQGLCEPRIQVGARAELFIVYESDVGPMPLMATSASVVDAEIATLEHGPTADRIALTGISVGETTVELRLRGYDEPAWFSLSVESDPPMYDCDGRDPPGFDIDGSGQPPQ